MRWPRNTSGVHATGADGATVKAAPAATEATASSTAGVGVIGNQRCGDQNEC
jgi:hypothetical protein